jgi:hypothetical protein
MLWRINLCWTNHFILAQEALIGTRDTMLEKNRGKVYDRYYCHVKREKPIPSEVTIPLGRLA